MYAAWRGATPAEILAADERRLADERKAPRLIAREDRALAWRRLALKIDRAVHGGLKRRAAIVRDDRAVARDGRAAVARNGRAAVATLDGAHAEARNADIIERALRIRRAAPFIDPRGDVEGAAAKRERREHEHRKRDERSPP